MKKITFSLIAVLLAVTFGCAKSPSEKLVGKWQTVGDDQSVMEFFSDGTFKADATIGKSKRNINGNWSVLEDGRLKLDFLMMGNTLSTVMKFSVDHDKMTTTDDHGKTIESIRIK